MTDADLSHGAFVPLLVGYIVWQRRDALRALKPSPSLFGLALMVLGAVLLCIGPPSLDTFAAVTRAAFMLSLIGTILYMRGFATPLDVVLPALPAPADVPDARFCSFRAHIPPSDRRQQTGRSTSSNCWDIRCCGRETF